MKKKERRRRLSLGRAHQIWMGIVGSISALPARPSVETFLSLVFLVVRPAEQSGLGAGHGLARPAIIRVSSPAVDYPRLASQQARRSVLFSVGAGQRWSGGGQSGGRRAMAQAALW